MFTTRVGPQHLGESHLETLRNGIVSNLAQDSELEAILHSRTGHREVPVLEAASFDTFFKLAVPKVIASALMDEDWFVDPAGGIKVYEFERTTKDRQKYTILHFVMDVKEHSPPKRQRAPGSKSAAAAAAYQAVVRQLFSTPEIVVDETMIDKAALQESLDKIASRRKKYRSLLS